MYFVLLLMMTLSIVGALIWIGEWLEKNKKMSYPEYLCLIIAISIVLLGIEGKITGGL